MAYKCVLGRAECDGCGECEERPAKYDIYSDPIYKGEEYYEIEGDVIHNDNIMEYVRDRFQVTCR